MSKVNAVIFDLDGTLIDSLADLATAMNHALSEHDFPTHSVASYNYHVGDGVDVLVQRTLPETARSDPDTCASVTSLMQSYYKEHWHVQTQPYPGIDALLSDLTETGLPLAVLSNKPDHFTKSIVAHFFPETPWSVVEGAKPPRPIKPDPAGPRDLIAQLQLPASHIAFVGDTSTDMQTAVNAGFQGVGVTWGFRPEAELREYGAEQIVHTTEELLAVLRD